MGLRANWSTTRFVPGTVAAAGLVLLGVLFASGWGDRTGKTEASDGADSTIGGGVYSMSLDQLLDEAATPARASLQGDLRISQSALAVDPRRLPVHDLHGNEMTLGEMDDRCLVLLDARRDDLAMALVRHERHLVVDAIVGRVRLGGPSGANLLGFAQRLPPSWISDTVDQLSGEQVSSSTWSALSYLASMKGVVVGTSTLQRLVQMATPLDASSVAKAADNCPDAGAREVELRRLLERLGSTMTEEDRRQVEMGVR